MSEAEWTALSEKVNLVELTITGGGTPLGPPAETVDEKSSYLSSRDIELPP